MSKQRARGTQLQTYLENLPPSKLGRPSTSERVSKVVESSTLGLCGDARCVGSFMAPISLINLHPREQRLLNTSLTGVRNMKISSNHSKQPGLSLML